MVPERLETERLILRRLTRRDAEPVTQAVLASLPELSKWLPWAHTAYGREDAAAFIRESVQAWRDGRAFDFAIRHKHDPDTHLGNVSIWQVSKMGKTGEIGYWVRSDFTSSGIGTEAAAKALQVGFFDLGFHKVNLRIAVGNQASERIADKLGFKKDGILREELMVRGRWLDHSLWSMLETELRATPGQLGFGAVSVLTDDDHV